MKKLLLDFLFWSSKINEKLRLKLSETDSEQLDYSSLSPIDNGDKNGHYSKALQWALQNRKEEDIKNIALTGSYGSGKSTILKTFQKNYSSDFEFLNISLATFKEEKNNSEKNKKPEKDTDKENILRLIETSILQQIFYHEEDKNIPDSRFKKIISYSGRKLFFTSLGFLLFVISLLNNLYPHLIQSIFKDTPLSSSTCNIVHYGSVLITLIGIFFIVYKSIRIMSSLTINKLKFQNAEIGIGDSLNKSILNHHLDEILYFFTKTPYNVVIIEDLDRFHQTEIFTKLREINHLLNNSKKINKNIVFIYAVRDDMFSDDERIKFFDFIIPVIPVINYSNSSEILLQKKKKYNYELTDTFIEDISFFIGDMRLLHNITNEFYLYKVKQGETGLKQDKLFAIITYKNMYPNDFVALSKNKGHLYEILTTKSELVSQQIKKIENKISNLKNKIKNIEEVNIKSTSELRQLYLIRVIETLDNFKSFVINDQEISINELIKDENFEYLISNELYYKCLFRNNYNYNNFEYHTRKIPTKFPEIEKLVNPNKSYNLREEEISDLNSNKSNSLRQDISELEIQKTKIRETKISELLQSNEEIDLNIDDNLNKDFITLLIKNGYISEDYLDYISLFHEGSITRNDHKFIISVRNKLKLDFDYKLTEIDKIISKINLINFNSAYILNYDLVDFLLNNHSTNKVRLDYIFTKLKDESVISTSFINGYIIRTDNLKLFIQTLCEYWINIWGYYINDERYLEAQSDEILKNIIAYADIQSIKKIDEKSNVKGYLNKYPEILNTTSNIEKHINVIAELQLKFNDIDIENYPKEIVEYIYKNDHYELNQKIVHKLVKKYGQLDQVSFDNSNYSSLKNSTSDSLISYIDNNIDDYIENLYLKIDTNINEEQTSYLELLNHSDLNLKLKEKLIAKVATKISDISLLETTPLWAYSIENNKIETTWENLLFFFKNSEDKILDPTIGFINNIENASKLAKIKIEVNGKNKYNEFCKLLIESEDINIESYDLILKSIPWWYNNLNIANIDKEKIHSLIKNSCIAPKIESFKSLKENYDGLHIELLENNKSKFLKLDVLDLDANDVELLLKSTIINSPTKIKFLETCTDDVIISNTENIKLISQLVIDNSLFRVNNVLIKNIILNNNVTTINRIKIFNMNFITVDNTFIENFLKNLGGNYEVITNKNKKAKIQKNNVNIELLDNLESKGYISSHTKYPLNLRVNHKTKQ